VRSQRGFTLLEVLVAIAILGLGLTAILSAQFSAVNATGHARHMNAAVGLLRCKMTEVEQDLVTQGLPEIDMVGSGACCEGDATPNMSCTWRVERPTFPDANYGDLDLDTDLEQSPLGKLSESAQSGEPVTAGDISDVASSLAGDGDIGAALAGGVGGIASMVMTMVYPDLKNLFEASARRVTVVLTWSEGTRTFDMELTQWVTQPQPGLAAEIDGGGGASSTPSGSPSSGTGQGSGRGSGSGNKQPSGMGDR
jgi:general secretion pathway protein I